MIKSKIKVFLFFYLDVKSIPISRPNCKLNLSVKLLFNEIPDACIGKVISELSLWE